MFLEACLGISIDTPARRITIDNPQLPESISRFWVRHLQVGSATVDLQFERDEKKIRAEVLEQRGDLEVRVETT